MKEYKELPTDTGSSLEDHISGWINNRVRESGSSDPVRTRYDIIWGLLDHGLEYRKITQLSTADQCKEFFRDHGYDIIALMHDEFENRGPLPSITKISRWAFTVAARNLVFGSGSNLKPQISQNK